MEHSYSERDSSSAIGSPLSLSVRLTGLGVLIVGLITSFHVVKRAWLLLDEPQTIENFADEVERQSHINAAIARMPPLNDILNPLGPQSSPAFIPLPPGSKLPTTKEELDTMTNAINALPTPGAQSPTVPNALSNPPKSPKKEAAFNGAFFAAWLLQLMVLGLIARIGLWAVVEGGKLAVARTDQEQMLQRIFRELIRESRSAAK